MTGIVSAREVARLLGLSHTAVQKAERTGRITREPDGTWDVEKVRCGLAVRTNRGPAPGRPRTGLLPWARPARQAAAPDSDIAGPALAIHTDLEQARRALERAARQIAALYPEILHLDIARDATIAAQECASE